MLYRLFVLFRCFLFFISMEKNDHVREGAVVIPYLLYMPQQFAFPCFLLFVLLIKKVKSQKNP